MELLVLVSGKKDIPLHCISQWNKGTGYNPYNLCRMRVSRYNITGIYTHRTIRWVPAQTRPQFDRFCSERHVEPMEETP